MSWESEIKKRLNMQVWCESTHYKTPEVFLHCLVILYFDLLEDNALCV